MLQLKNVVKTYETGSGENVPALRGISIAFRDSEFVSVLGPSGCGKTTLLNILGGLDHYTSGDLIINGRSTKEYKDADWDTYRNHSVGFVFQSYNLIPHQTVLSNVELALTLSGVSRAERRRRAAEALERVGLSNQLRKRPNQMSGGQMQRVAIARALVNDPDILLADEPTGALDTGTSVQIMDILKEISKDKLILMVTHNPELAETYSGRIVRLLDGEVVGDTHPYDPKEAETAAEKRREAVAAAGKKRRKKGDGTGKGKRSMSFFTALSLSLQNLMTKKARTLLTSFAGSIGIIGIALILALSTGVQAYIDTVQRDTLTSYPITIEAETTDITALLVSMTGASQTEDKDTSDHLEHTVYSNPQMFNLFNSLFAAEKQVNNLTAFREYLEAEMQKDGEEAIARRVSSVSYRYGLKMHTYGKGADGNYLSTDVADALAAFGSGSGSSGMYSLVSRQVQMIDLWTEFLPGKDGALLSDLYAEQYDLYGEWPQSASDILLILDGNGEISDFAFYALGLIPDSEVTDMMASALSGEKIPITRRSLSYDDVIGTTFSVLTEAECYTDNDGDGVFVNSRSDDATMKLLLANAVQIRICGIIQPKEGSSVTSGTAAFGYTSALTAVLIENSARSPVLTAQTAPENENRDVLTGLPFVITKDAEPDDGKKASAVQDYFASLTDAEKTEVYTKILSEPDDEVLNADLDKYMALCATREAMEQMAANAYGMDVATIKTYLSAYSDEELRNMIREQMATVLREQYAAAAKEKVRAQMLTPTEDELTAITATVVKSVGETRMARVGYILSNWSENIGMDAASMLTYLNQRTEEELDALVVDVARRSAAALYAENAGAEGDAANAKIAALFDALWQAADEATLAGYYDRYMPSAVSGSTLSEVLSTLGCVDEKKPVSISIYAEKFEDKDAIADFISAYNETASEEDTIHYTDYVALIMSGVTGIINAISYGLIAFVAISLVVSSIMIGIITYISVLERTKEIGILRAIGASKRDVSSVFNAETLIVGFTAGMMGILISLLLCLPINAIIHALSGITAINAFLPPVACVVLVAISMTLTLIAGILPAGIAARRDPVVALRSE